MASTKQKSAEVKAMENIENAVFLRDAVWVDLLLKDAQTNRFHGSIELKFEKGLVMRAITTKSLMPPHRDGG